MNYFPFNYLQIIGSLKFVNYFFSKLIFLYLISIIILNLRKFKKANSIFLNSYAFGHSVTETTIFFDEYGVESICLSIGSRDHRNKYLCFLYVPYTLLHFWLPRIHDINVYHALRKRAHDAIDLQLKESKIIKFMTGRNLQPVTRQSMLDLVATKNLENVHKLSESLARDFISKINLEYSIAQDRKETCTLHYLVQQPSPLIPNPNFKIKKFDQKFQKALKRLSESIEIKPRICSIIIRKSWKPWSGNGLKSYIQTIDYLNEHDYIVNILGDVNEFISYRISNNLKAAFCFLDYNLDDRIFQILSIMNSEFCIGDQSGLQALVHFFNKKHLIINTVPFVQVQYNGVSLPRIWHGTDGTVMKGIKDIESYLYRIHPKTINPNKTIFPLFHDSATIVKSVKMFIDQIELHGAINGLEPCDLIGSDNLANYSSNSFFSPVLMDFFD